jgi:hypothetical protein
MIISLKTLLLSIVISIFITGCFEEKFVFIEQPKKQNKPIVLNQNKQPKQVVLNNESKIKFNSYTQTQQEFIQILKNDKYASICDQKYFIDDLIDQDIEQLFLSYTKNLANGCLDIKSNSDFNIYKQKVNDKEILEKFNSNNYTVEQILKPYIPNHPWFFKMIDKLNDETLSSKQKYKLRLNIERMKLLKNYKTKNFIQLNIPQYGFDFFENGKVVMSFGTIVGDLENKTPVLSSKLKYFIVNPTWNIPDSIAKKTIIPRMLKNKNYLKKKHIEIHKNYKLTSPKYRQKDINWKKYLKKNVKYIPYKFIQLPYASNGLGRVKFIFPNNYAVYMHDTIGTWRFKQNKQKIRAVSHGCVRLEHPLALIKYISTHYTKRSYKSVRKIYDSHKLKTISLSKPLAVHITYFTTTLDKNGNLKFHNDLYGYDKVQKLNFEL